MADPLMAQCSTNVVGCRNEDIYIKMPVEAVLEDIILPKFSPVG
jgi:hypothetical protein